MITLTKVKSEIKELISADREEVTSYELNKMRKRVAFLEVVKKYLEDSPSEEFVRTEKARIGGLVDKIKDGFSAWYEWNKDKGEDYKQCRNYYEKEMELKKYKTQFKALDFILQ